MANYKRPVLAMMFIASLVCTGNVAMAGERWQEDTFPPPNGGWLVFTVTEGGNPACASYDGRTCLWGTKMGDIDFTRVKPLACGAAHRELYGVTGFEDPNHWCNRALRVWTAAKNAKSPGNGATPQTAPARPSQSAGGYRLTNWSGWGRAAGVEYRYRVGWDPANGGPGKTVDAMYQVRNSGAQRWSGAARSLNCGQNTLWGSTDVDLSPGQIKEVRVRAPNCGNATNPAIRPDVVRAGRFD